MWEKVIRSKTRNQALGCVTPSAQLPAGSMVASARGTTPRLPSEDTVKLGPGAPGTRGCENTVRKRRAWGEAGGPEGTEELYNIQTQMLRIGL